jgi:hypothetical protein
MAITQTGEFNCPTPEFNSDPEASFPHVRPPFKTKKRRYEPVYSIPNVELSDEIGHIDR